MRRIIFVIIGIAILVTAGFFGWRWFDGDEDSAKNDLAADEPEEEGEQLYDLEPIVTDLLPRDGGERSIVRVDMELRCRDSESLERVTDHGVYVRDEILGILRGTHPEELKGDSGMQELRRRIVERVNGILAEGEIVDVYFTEMMVQ